MVSMRSVAPRAEPESSAADRRQEMGMFLRSRRERTAPHQVGLPELGRRRTPGLRREEVAALAGISTTWYTFLEQGRPARASGEVLHAIADALHLDAAERSHLDVLAAHQADAGGRGEPAEYLSAEVAGVPDLLEPSPAYVTGSSLDLLAYNRAAAALFAPLIDRDGRPPNLVRWVFTEPAALEVLLDWEIVASGLLARLRANAGRHPKSARFTDLVVELRDRSPDANAWWPRYDIATNSAGTKRVRRPDGQEMALTYASFHVAEHPEFILTVYRRT